MIAQDNFNVLKMLIDEASQTQDINSLLDKLKNMNLQAVGELNYMLANYVYQASDGSNIKFHYHSYDPSGPFQNLPDINKIKLELFNGQELIAKHDARFEDK